MVVYALNYFLCTYVCVVQESRDPRKLHWLFEMLMESPVTGEGGSFVDAWYDISATLHLLKAEFHGLKMGNDECL